MSLYSVVVFLHVLGATGMVASLALEGVTLARVTRAPTIESARDRLGGMRSMVWVGMPAMLVVLATGIFLARFWEGQARWLAVAMPSFLLIPAFGLTLSRKGMRALRAALAGAWPVQRLGSQTLWISWWARLATVVGIVFLMEVKPPLHASLTAMGVVLVGGVAGSFVRFRRNVAQ